MDVIHALASVALGLYAGSLLTEGALLVPYWRTLSGDEFFSRHGDFGPRLYRYFFPITNAAVWLTVLSAALDGFSNGLRNAAALLVVAALGTYFLYFQKANASFADHSLAESALPAELARWSAWHWARTAASLLAFVLSVLAFL
ncbi:MAG: hypothetical protein AAF499_01105 [Pseudomonadota bacterium]